MANGVQGLCDALVALKGSIKEPQGAVRGIIRGSCVIVGNRSYAMSIAIDAPLKSGDAVWVQFSDDMGTAVVIGV